MNEKEIDDVIKQAKALQNAGVKGRVGVAAVLNFRNAKGEIVQTMKLEGSVPFDKLSEQSNGTSDS